MQFRNLLAYRLTQALEIDQAALDQALATKRIRPCGSQDASTVGFVNPLNPRKVEAVEKADQGASLSLWAENCALICMLAEHKILPATGINQKVTDKVDLIEAEQSRKVYKKEKDQIRDEVLQEYLPKALSKRSATYAAIDLKDGFIYVDASTHKQAEALLSTLREAIGSLPVRPVSVKIAPTATLTDWVKNQNPTHGFYIRSDCEMRTTSEDSAVAKFTNEDLGSTEVLHHLEAGKIITRLSLAYEDKLGFVLHDKLQLKSLRMEDVLLDKAMQDGGDDSASQFTATFAMWILTLRSLIPALLEALGGEEIPTGIGTGSEAETSTTSAASPVDLYPSAEQFVISSQRASISALQRKLKVGYNVAARLIEQMESNGVVSAPSTNGARTVLKTAA